MAKKFETEREGQIAFFKQFSIPYVDEEVLLGDTDGVYNGILFEFKLTIENLNEVVFQQIKYLSRFRLQGKDVPATMLVVDLNARKAYEYKTEDYRDDVQKVYAGAASKNNAGYVAKDAAETYEYTKDLDASKLRHLIQDNKTLEELVFPIDIDASCVVGWSNRYYRDNPTASKGDFLGDEEGESVSICGEIREPRHFRGRINPYPHSTNAEFKFLMDMLNDRMSKKGLGAFYTPPHTPKRLAS